MVSVLLFVYRIYFAQLSSNSQLVKFYAGISSAFNVTDSSADNLLDNMSALEVIRKMQFDKTIIITHRPVVDSGWYEDYKKIWLFAVYSG